MTRKKMKKKVKILLIFLISIFVFILGLKFSYDYLVSPVDKTSSVDVKLTIERGTTTKSIAHILKENKLIKSEVLFQVKVKLEKRLLKAAAYQLRRNMSLNEIVDILTDGNKYNPDAIRLTFLEGQRLEQFASVIASHTIHSKEYVLSVFTNREYTKTLIEKYWFLTDEILNENIYYPLEGYLAPNTYEFKNKEIKVEEIIETMLDESDRILKPYQSLITNNGYTLHEYLTIASILELEGINYEDRQMIAGVFQNRIDNNMNLGSDVTTYYALKKPMDTDLTAFEFNTSNPYNTRALDMAAKLPVGPICNPSTSAIKASFNPMKNDYLFFVADKNGKIYYTKTAQEHDQKVNEIKEEGNWIW